MAAEGENAEITMKTEVVYQIVLLLKTAMPLSKSVNE
jgi:hypothetical protein